jgi:hypothetical protein
MVRTEVLEEVARRFGYLTDATRLKVDWRSDPIVADLYELLCAPLRGDAGATAR